MTERAERKRQFKSLETAMLTDLSNSILNDASDFVPVYAAIVDGASPMLTAVVSLMPFILTLTGAFIMSDAYVVSIILTLATLFSLGLYLGKIAEENVLLYGVQTLAAGIIIVAIIALFGAI